MATERLSDMVQRLDALMGRACEIEDAVTVARLMWPSFVVYRGVLLLDFIAGDPAKQERLDEMIDSGVGERTVQENFNFVEVNFAFPRAPSETINEPTEAFRELATLLASSWTAKLATEGFPDYEAVAAEWFAEDEWSALLLRKQ